MNYVLAIIPEAVVADVRSACLSAMELDGGLALDRAAVDAGGGAVFVVSSVVSAANSAIISQLVPNFPGVRLFECTPQTAAAMLHAEGCVLTPGGVV